MKALQLLVIILVFGWVCGVVEAGAAAKISLEPLPEGGYSITAANVTKAASLGFTIPYDSAMLGNPVITDGPFAKAVGALRVANEKNGVLTVQYIVTVNNVYFQGGGLLATVRPTKTGTTPTTNLSDFKSEIVSYVGTQMAVESVVATPAGTDNKTYLSGYNTGTNTTKPTNQNYDNMGNLPSRPSTQTVTSSDAITSQPPIFGAGQESSSRIDSSSPEEYANETPQQQSRAEDSGTAAVQDVVTPAVAGPSQKTDPDSTVEVLLKELKLLESVAERFRAYKGARTLKGFSELFDDSRYKAAGVVQIPSIAVSDGNKMITVKVSLPVGSGVPSFSLKGANLKGIKNLSDRSLELDAMLQEGKLDVRMSIVIQKEVAEIPLLVVPPLSGDILEQSDQALEKLLSKVDGKNKSLLYDLNADSKQDYLDDYILVAHWLLKQQRDKKAPAAKAAVPR